MLRRRQRLLQEGDLLLASEKFWGAAVAIVLVPAAAGVAVVFATEDNNRDANRYSVLR